jgi:uncharacterized protein (UPF0276 family)
MAGRSRQCFWVTGGGALCQDGAAVYSREKGEQKGLRDPMPRGFVIQLTADLSDPLLDLVRDDKAPIDAVEVGPWFSVQQIRDYRQMLPELPFYFHGADLIEGVGLVPGAISRIAAYLHCTESPWVSMHITMWLPGMVGLMLRRGWRMPLPNPERAARRFVQRVRRLARSIQVPVILENIAPLPFDGYLDRVVQVHVSGPRMRDGSLVDAHEALQEIDYALLDFVLARTEPQVVTLEYIRERDALEEQLFRLRDVLKSFDGLS